MKKITNEALNESMKASETLRNVIGVKELLQKNLDDWKRFIDIRKNESPIYLLKYKRLYLYTKGTKPDHSDDVYRVDDEASWNQFTILVGSFLAENWQMFEDHCNKTLNQRHAQAAKAVRQEALKILGLDDQELEDESTEKGGNQ